MIYIGIDPGGGGGIAILDDRAAANCLEVHTFNMPSTDRDVLETLAPYTNMRARAVLEHVWSIPGQGGAFAFGVNVGLLRMALTAARIPFDQVIPRKWQKLLGVVYPQGAGDTEKKNITKARAQQLFPLCKVTHAIADALLIAEYCRRLERSDRALTDSMRGIDGKEDEAGKEREGSKEGQGQRRKPFDGYQPQGRTRRGPRQRTAQSDAPRHGTGADRKAR